jgi:hypothetical protein
MYRWLEKTVSTALIGTPMKHELKVLEAIRVVGEPPDQ